MIAVEQENAADPDRDGSIAAQMLDLFFLRRDCWAFQWYSKARDQSGYSKACWLHPPWENGRCKWKEKDGRVCSKCPDWDPIAADETIMAMHLAGDLTLGAYQIGQDSTSVIWSCLDFDDHGETPAEEIENAVWIALECLDSLHLPAAVETSGGNGARFHVWCFFAQPVAAIKVKAILDWVLAETGLTDKDFIERFPKQSRALNGYGNLVKVPFGIHRKTMRRSQFVDPVDLRTPFGDVGTALSTIQLIDPGTVDFIIDMKHIEPVQSDIGILPPDTSFDRPVAVMNNLLTRCKYFAEVERQQMSPEGYVPYEDWFNYVMFLSHFGQAGVDRIMRVSAMDERFDPEFTIKKINYIRGNGYHMPSCKHLIHGPGQIKCNTEPMFCGAG